MLTNSLSQSILRALRSGRHYGALLAVPALLSSIPVSVFAQDANKDSPKLETIEVTGSNIRRVDVETSNPVVTIDAATIQQSGKLTLGDLLQDLPAVTGGNTNPQVNNGGGGGSSSIGLRGLSSARTLVLIDGHRIVNQDPNSIPINLIERVEVLTDGASSVYGSDAIGGVVNFITKTNYQGAQFSTDYGISDHDDGVRKGYHFVFGQTSDKGSIVAGVDYNHTDEISANNRKFSQNAVSITGSPQTPPYTFIGGSTFAPNGRIQLPGVNADGSFQPGSLAAQFGCGFVALNPGAAGTAANSANFHCFQNNGAASDKFNYAKLNIIETPQERASAFVKGTYKLTDNVEAYFDYIHNKTTSASQLAPALFGSASPGETGGSISSQSYYNPFGLDYNPFGGADFRLRLVSVGDRGADNSTSTDQVSTGFKGTFQMPMSNADWNWDAGFNYGHVSTFSIASNLLDQNALEPALGPSFLNPATNTVVCGTPGNIIAGCTPINLFNQFDPKTAAELKSFATPASENTFSIEKYEHIDLNGGLFDLPAGTVQLAIGASHRTEYTDNFVDSLLTLDPATGSCALGSQCSAHLQGGYSVKEIYAETLIPILKDVPFVNSLNLTLGDRYSKYSDFGSTSNWKVALEYRPIEDLLLRGTVSQVFRAPTIANIFGAPVSSAPALGDDPCTFIAPASNPHAANPNAGNPACKGVAPTGTFIDTAVATHQQISALASGSQFAGFPLGPENGKSFDFGFVYDPHWLEGLSISADAYRVYLLNNISGVAAQDVLNLCFQGQTQYCDLISRVQSGPNQGQISQIIDPTVNLGRIDTSGVDVGIKYRLPEFSFGRFTAMLNATYLTEYNLQTAPGTSANQVYNNAGQFLAFNTGAEGVCPGNTGVCVFPRWRAQTALNWNLGAFDASWRMRYIGRFKLGSDNISEGETAVPSFPNYILKFGATVYNDVSLGYNIAPINTRIDLGIDNIANKQPPNVYANNSLNAGTDPSTFDLIGRFYHASVTVKF